MSSRIDRNSPRTGHTSTQREVPKDTRGGKKNALSVSKVMKLAVGLLGVSQGLPSATAARPRIITDGLALPNSGVNGAGGASRQLKDAHQYTYIVNDSDQDIVGTMTYHCLQWATETSKFTNRPIPAHQQDRDEYYSDPSGTGVSSCFNGDSAAIHVDLGIKTAQHKGSFSVPVDKSIVVQNRPNNQVGLDVYQTKDGTLHQAGDLLGQIYNN